MLEIFSHPVVSAVVLIGLLIFIHETGHFLVGRWRGIAVEIYSIGFGPPIFSIRRGHTEYRLSLLPLGGFVKFYGSVPSEPVPDELKGQEFVSASFLSRMLTVAAGPLANFIFAVFAFSILGFHGIEHPKPLVGDIQDGSSAEKAGLRFGDEVLNIDNRPVSTWDQMREIVAKSAGKQLRLSVRRDGAIEQVTIVPDEDNGEDLFGNKVRVGRLGITRGATPAIISVAEVDSIAYRAGLRTGERILAVSSDDGRNFKNCEFWYECASLISRLMKPQQQFLAIQSAPTHKDGQAKSELMKEVRLNVSGVSADENLRKLMNGLGIEDAQLVVGESSDAKALLQRNDLLTRYNGQDVKNLVDLTRLQAEAKSADVELEILRDGKLISVKLTLEPSERQTPRGREVYYFLPLQFLGIPKDVATFMEKYDDPFSALVFGTKETVKQTLGLLFVLGNLIIGNVPIKSLGGPMMIAKVASDAAQAGWHVYLGTMAMISINLGVLNMLPLPALDGGQMVLFTFEKLRRRRLSQAGLENFQKLGFVFILALIVLATYNDLSRFWVSVLRSVSW